MAAQEGGKEGRRKQEREERDKGRVERRAKYEKISSGQRDKEKRLQRTCICAICPGVSLLKSGIPPGPSGGIPDNPPGRPPAPPAPAFILLIL